MRAKCACPKEKTIPVIGLTRPAMSPIAVETAESVPEDKYTRLMKHQLHLPIESGSIDYHGSKEIAIDQIG